jgi:hypothetical protein
MKLCNAALFVKALIVTGALAATTVGLAAPAWAGQNVKVEWGGRVYGAFHHKGDWLQLVDHCNTPNQTSTGYLQVRNGAEIKTYYATNGPNGEHICGERWINRNFREGRDIGIRVCLVEPGPDACKPWRWGIA